MEEVSGPLPTGDPPVLGNLLPNAGFEMGGDGWFTRGPVEFVTAPDAYEGKRVAVMHGVKGQDILSSTLFRLSFASDYLAQVRVKAVTDTAQVHLYTGGKELNVKVNRADGWKTLSMPFHPQPPAGKFVPFLEDALYLECLHEGDFGDAGRRFGAGGSRRSDRRSLRAEGAAGTGPVIGCPGRNAHSRRKRRCHRPCQPVCRRRYPANS